MSDDLTDLDRAQRGTGTNPGVWALHCHILSHVEGPQCMFGMATALIVR